MQVRIRSATARDMEAISELLLAERQNVEGLDWRNFTLAVARDRLVGTAQLRPLDAGEGHELTSLVVDGEYRQGRVVAQLLDHVLDRAEPGVMMMVAARDACYYRRWGFRRITLGLMPMAYLRCYLRGQAAALLGPLRGRAPRRIVVLERFEGIDPLYA